MLHDPTLTVGSPPSSIAIGASYSNSLTSCNGSGANAAVNVRWAQLNSIDSAKVLKVLEVVGVSGKDYSIRILCINIGTGVYFIAEIDTSTSSEMTISFSGRLE